jgi:hypothetical protein
MWRADVSTSFPTTQIVQTFGIPTRRVIHLAERGVVVPEHGDAGGRGSSRGYSRYNVFEFLLADRLVALGWPYHRVSWFMVALRAFRDRVVRDVPQLWTDIEGGTAPWYLHVWDDRYCTVSPLRHEGPEGKPPVAAWGPHVFELRPDGSIRPSSRQARRVEEEAVVTIRIDLGRLMSDLARLAGSGHD